jgi:hypothetical protein
LAIGAPQGLWRRTLIERPGSAPDRSTAVFWLQGRSGFVDLRQPPDRPSFEHVRCLRQLGDREIAWLASQEGFAGTLAVAGDRAEWHRAIDIQPATGIADRARLSRIGDRLAEYGTEAEYFEEWELQPGETEPCWDVALADGALRGRLLRVGAVFAYARSRPRPLAGEGTLAARVAAAPSLAARQDLVDIEISLGRIVDDRWTIERSSLPFKEGTILAPQAIADRPERLQIADLEPGGDMLMRRWHIVGVDHPAGLAGVGWPMPPDRTEPTR